MSIRRAVACSGRGPVSTTNFSGTGKDSAVPLGRALWIATQALRAWLLSACPSGTKGIGLSRASHQVTAYGRDDLPTGRRRGKVVRITYLSASRPGLLPGFPAQSIWN